MTAQEWIERIMVTKKGKHLIDAIADRDVLEEAADDALRALDNKSVWYARKFISEREEAVDRIQNMIILGAYPQKEYKAVIHHAPDKDREIYPLHFDPWSILFHAVKIVLEPIAERMMIFDSSAGRNGKGQTFGALRMQMFMRRYPEYGFFSQSDLRKFYLSIPHAVIIETLRQCINDELFIRMIIETVLDYHSDIEDTLLEEQQKKMKYCMWASQEPTPKEYRHCRRGIIIGSCIGQILTNMVLTRIDRIMKDRLHIKVYHRHCDDIYMGAKTLQEAEQQLNRLDYEMNRIGLVVKSTSFAAPLKDENKNNNGRAADYIGYVFSRKNMLMRKRNKVNFAKAIARVKSRRRRREILASYWGISKWGHCRNLWRTITDNKKMGFADLGIKVQEVTEKDGQRYFHVASVSVSGILNLPIDVEDFEDNVKIREKSGRCIVVFSQDGEKKKFITSSLIIRDQLNKARELEKESGKQVFPIKTAVRRKNIGEGKSTYYFE